MSFSKFPPKKTETYIFKPRPKHEWSLFQRKIFKDIAFGTGHTIIEAYAGSGKTSTLVESFRFIPKGRKALALAFNKNIADTLRSQAPFSVSVSTFHSLGLQAIKQRFGNIEIDDYKVFNLVSDQLDREADKNLIGNICDTVAFCKYGLLDTPRHIDEIIDRFDIDTCEIDRDRFINLVVKTLALDKANTTKVDFNDMCWTPFVYNLPLGRYDYVFVDEFQDLNKSQLVMARKACNPNGGRIIAAGDDQQNLYSWRMSDTTVLDAIRKQENTKILTLPISYRCPKKVIELAKNWVPDITCPDTAIEGEIKNISLNQLYNEVTPGCFILSRTNAALIKVIMELIRRGVKANIKGRDIGAHLSYLIKKSKKRQIPAFLKWLENWKNEEVERLQKKNINPENTLDRYECLLNLCEEAKSLEEVNQKISDLFDDTEENNIVMGSTVHRAKGNERDDVFLLRWTFSIWFDQMDLIEKPNENANIAYVGITRARKRLFIVRKNASEI